jgi:SAM-dependent methyltransferase
MAAERTMRHYSEHANEYNSQYEKLKPTKLYDLAKVYFSTTGKTYDIGAGTGRDAVELQNLGFNVTAIEPVKEFAEICKSKLGATQILQDELPALKSLDAKSAANIFCSTVIMHLPESELLSALFRLVEILNDEGVMILSWRNSTSEFDREGDRLFGYYTGQQVSEILTSYGCENLYYRYEFSDPTRPEIPFYNLVVKKKSQALIGLARIQTIITNDRKTATYKLALLRAICEIAQIEAFSVRHSGEFVEIPMEKIAKLWVIYYWNPVAFGDRQIKSAPGMAFQNLLFDFIEAQKKVLPRNFYETTDGGAEDLINKVIRTISDQPVVFISDEGGQVFNVISKAKSNTPYGVLQVPALMWRDFVLYGHWIEKGILLEWAIMTADINNRTKTLGQYLDNLIESRPRDRDSAIANEARGIFSNASKTKNLECVWSGKSIEPASMHIDHMLPFSENHIEHLWNLLPTHKDINSNKKNHIPSVGLVRSRIDCIRSYWDIYAKTNEARFARELKNGLDLKLNDLDTSLALDRLIERVTHQVNIRGMQYWTYSK